MRQSYRCQTHVFDELRAGVDLLAEALARSCPFANGFDATHQPVRRWSQLAPGHQLPPSARIVARQQPHRIEIEYTRSVGMVAADDRRSSGRYPMPTDAGSDQIDTTRCRDHRITGSRPVRDHAAAPTRVRTIARFGDARGVDPLRKARARGGCVRIARGGPISVVTANRPAPRGAGRRVFSDAFPPCAETRICRYQGARPSARRASR